MELEDRIKLAESRLEDLKKIELYVGKNALAIAANRRAITENSKQIAALTSVIHSRGGNAGIPEQIRDVDRRLIAIEEAQKKWDAYVWSIKKNVATWAIVSLLGLLASLMFLGLQGRLQTPEQKQSLIENTVKEVLKGQENKHRKD